MTPDPHKIKNLFGAALDQPDPAARRAFLDRECGTDSELRQRLETLMNAHDAPASALNRLLAEIAPEIDAPPPTIDQPITESPGTVIGRYKLIEEIGEGGMGTVWMAQQTEPVRRAVAVKLIKPGMDSKQVLARFEAERQALALMDHPNIARVLDAGATEGGRPYFVMELVKGVPITKYCDSHCLTLKQRLELFMPVCQAVQHAHQKGIIHRDIKPTNVLIALYDGKPVPKVIDFGVAKAAGQQLTDKTLMTGFGSVVGTLEYMSPEQAELNQLDIDTRSDIYSLGVVLYELLTGSTPLDRKRLKLAAFAEVLRLIREEEPQKPSTRLSHSTDSLPSISAQRQLEPTKLTRVVRGELDWIVMKALEKDRSRRYETANGLAMDVQRYLADEAVLACPPSAGYRLKKFARRNRGRLAAAAVLSVALLAAVGAAAASIGWVARDRAERQNRLVGQAGLILDDAERLEREQKWAEAEAAAERAEAVLEGGVADNAVRERIGEVQRDRAFVAELERVRQIRAASVDGDLDYSGAARGYASAFRKFGVDVETLPVEESVSRLKKRPALVPPIAGALDDWAHARWALDRNDPGFSNLVAVARALDPDPMRDRVRAVWGRGVTPEIRANLRQLAESIDVKAQGPTTLLLLIATLQSAGIGDLALQTAQRSQLLYPGDFWLNIQLGNVLDARQDYGQAQVYCTIGISLRPDSALARSNLGHALAGQGDRDQAIACYRKAMELDPKYAAPHNGLGILYLDQKDFDKAIVCFKEAIELDPKDTKDLSNLGIVYTRQKKFDEAVACYRKAIGLYPKDAIAMRNLGLAYLKQHKLDEAVDWFQRAVEANPDYAPAHSSLGDALYAQGKPEEAIACMQNAIGADPKCVDAHVSLGIVLRDQRKLDEAIRCFQTAIGLDPRNGNAHYNLGICLLDQMNREAAIPCFERAIEFGVGDGLGQSYNANAHNNLGYALLETGKLEQAIPHLRKAIELEPTLLQAHDNLGRAYLGLQRLDEAIACFHKVIELDPNAAYTHMNLGIALSKENAFDEAVESIRRAVKLDPKQGIFHYNLGITLRDQGKRDEAVTEFCEALRLDPTDWRSRRSLLEILAPIGRLEKVRAVWERDLASDPPNHDVWFGYAELCLFLNNENAYRRNRTALLKRFADTTDPAVAERTARASLLLPATGEELRTAVDLADRAVTLGKSSDNFRFYAAAKALAEYRLDRFESAVEWAQKPGVQGTPPMLLVLAMAHQRLGHAEQARQLFDEAIKTYNWANGHDEWGGIVHSLRREAEALLKAESGVKETASEKNSK